MEKDERYSLFCQMIDQLDRGAYLIEKYDSLLHDYYGAVLFQAESQMIKAIGDAPGITAAALAEKFDKTPSACSQLVRKLKAKGWVKQIRNCSNSREYNLTLTGQGQEIYQKHQDFENACYRRTFQMLDGVSDEELKSYIKIQQRLNQAFELDVKESEQLKI